MTIYNTQAAVQAAAVPGVRPHNPRFSAGPTTKFMGWSPEALRTAELGRSHRSKPGKAKLNDIITRSKALLGIPDDWVLGIIAGSDTGAVECAMWNLLGPRGVDVLVWESFGADWAKDARELQLPDVRVLEAPYGRLPDLGKVDFSRDVVLTWNGTTSGVRCPHGDWIDPEREGLVIADATSAAFAMHLPWNHLDAVTWSWQKVLGGEAQHGMLALSPRALERLKSFRPPWPIPKIYRLRKGDDVNMGIFEGATLNTPSMLAVEDHLLALKWAEEIGGLPTLIKRTKDNFNALDAWLAETPWADWLAEDPATRSETALCIRITDPQITALPEEAQAAFAKEIVKLLDAEGVAHDIGAYRAAPPGLRIWGGATVETSDITALSPWLDWGFHTAKGTLASAI